jgi:hypothetical protein
MTPRFMGNEMNKVKQIKGGGNNAVEDWSIDCSNSNQHGSSSQTKDEISGETEERRNL